MSIYFLPALLALIFKLFVLVYVLKGARVSTLFLSLIVVFAAHNAIEILGYFYFDQSMSDSMFFRFYYVATAFVLLYMLLHGIAVARMQTQWSTYFLIGVTTLISAITLFTDLIIAGHYSIGYSLSAVKGPIFWLFAIFALTTLLGNIVVLIQGYRGAKSQIQSVRCTQSLYALGPVILVCFLTLIFKVTEVGINATGLIPIATTLFLAIVLKTESKHKLSDLRRLLPLSMERETTNNLMDLLDDYIRNSNEKDVYKKLQMEIEKEIIRYSLKKCDNNVSNTTKMMGLKNRSTLYSMMNRLKIEIPDRDSSTGPNSPKDS